MIHGFWSRLGEGRARVRLALCVCVGTLALASPAVADDGPSPEEEAALALFKEGRSSFGAGDYEQALTFFETARDVIDNVYVRFYLARTYAALDRCAEALPSLAELAGKLPEDAEGPRSLVTRPILASRPHSLAGGIVGAWGA